MLHRLVPAIEKLKLQLAQYPSEIEYREDISRALGFGFFIKRDDRLGKYGGNKVRKLEFLFADAILRKKKEIVVFGPTGSHHIIANLIYGREYFKKIISVVFPTYLWKSGDKYVVENTELIKRLSSKVIFTRNYITSFLIAKFLSFFRERYLIPPGSTSALSSLGFVVSAYEISEDVRAGRIPEPDFIFLPAGTMGTCAGLSAGLMLAGIKTKVLGVRVVEKIACNKFLAKKLAAATLRKITEIIRSKDPDREKEIKKLIGRAGENLELLDGFIGKGYGYPTDDGDKAVEFFSGFGLKVERTYTAKTLSAILNLKDKLAGKNVIFYYTLNTLPVAENK